MLTSTYVTTSMTFHNIQCDVNVRMSECQIVVDLSMYEALFRMTDRWSSCISVLSPIIRNHQTNKVLNKRMNSYNLCQNVFQTILDITFFNAEKEIDGNFGSEILSFANLAWFLCSHGRKDLTIIFLVEFCSRYRQLGVCTSKNCRFSLGSGPSSNRCTAPQFRRPPTFDHCPVKKIAILTHLQFSVRSLAPHTFLRLCIRCQP